MGDGAPPLAGPASGTFSFGLPVDVVIYGFLNRVDQWMCEFEPAKACLPSHASGTRTSTEGASDLHPELELAFPRVHLHHKDVEALVRHFVLHLRMAPGVVVTALNLLELNVLHCRTEKGGGYPFNTNNACALLTGSFLLAHKMVEDQGLKMRVWSKLSGLPVHVVRATERELLQGMGYELWPAVERFDRRLSEFWTQFMRHAASAVGVPSPIRPQSAAPTGSSESDTGHEPAVDSTRCDGCAGCDSGHGTGADAGRTGAGGTAWSADPHRIAAWYCPAA